MKKRILLLTLILVSVMLGSFVDESHSLSKIGGGRGRTTRLLTTSTVFSTRTLTTTVTATITETITETVTTTVTERVTTTSAITNQLTIGVSPSGGGSTSPLPGSYLYDSGSSVMIIETPATGYEFDCWNLDGLNVGSNPNCTVVMEAPHTLTAIFQQIVLKPTARLHTEGRWIKDSNSNIVRIKGAARHWSTFYWKDPLTAPDEDESIYDLFASTGANCVRLSLNKWAWEYAASTYRPAIDTIIQKWAQRQVYVVLDFHIIYDIDQDRSWTWEEKVDVILELNEWKEFMVDLARRYASYPNVIGFDLLNEPPAYKVWQDRGYNGTQAEAIWRLNVSKVIEVVHGVDPSYICFVEALGSEDLGVFMDKPLAMPNVVYSFHRYYGWDYPWYDYAISYGSGDFDKAFQQMEELYKQVAFNLLDMGYPVVLMETGTQKEQFTPNHIKQMDDLYTLLEQYQVGVMHWSYDRGYSNPDHEYLYLLTDDLSGLTAIGELWAKHMHLQ